jgi:hypothetical protein
LSEDEERLMDNYYPDISGRKRSYPSMLEGEAI